MVQDAKGGKKGTAGFGRRLGREGVLREAVAGEIDEARVRRRDALAEGVDLRKRVEVAVLREARQEPLVERREA